MLFIGTVLGFLGARYNSEQNDKTVFVFTGVRKMYLIKGGDRQ